MLQAFFKDEKDVYDECKGIFYGNVKTDEEDYTLFRTWVDEVLDLYRKKIL
ncbi:hypothetical protein KP78_25100 [Jeotgalibacillus soli]|uniref:Uncharacterized protein n=1 Tax=Jeotgalibacillus soli TaxID=889306 RepID=A0A0C2VKI6_9BACL|nr:hypothetical protein KP78_25100 [Jeotgalibacillus soli]